MPPLFAPRPNTHRTVQHVATRHGTRGVDDIVSGAAAEAAPTAAKKMSLVERAAKIPATVKRWVRYIYSVGISYEPTAGKRLLVLGAIEGVLVYLVIRSLPRSRSGFMYILRTCRVYYKPRIRATSFGRLIVLGATEGYERFGLFTRMPLLFGGGGGRGLFMCKQQEQDQYQEHQNARVSVSLLSSDHHQRPYRHRHHHHHHHRG